MSHESHEHDTAFSTLIAAQRRDLQEARRAADLDERSAFLLPLTLALARLAARRDAHALQAQELAT